MEQGSYESEHMKNIWIRKEAVRLESANKKIYQKNCLSNMEKNFKEVVTTTDSRIDQ